MLSISCSSSKRPFFQEGYLVQTEFTSDSDINKGELDFNRRIVAIYEFENNKKFWGSENPISKDNLYPIEDKMKYVCDVIKDKKYYLDDKAVDKNLMGEFLSLWNSLEEEVRYTTDVKSFLQGVKILVNRNNNLYEKNLNEINRLSKFRNEFVHRTNRVSNERLYTEINNLKRLLKELRIDV